MDLHVERQYVEQIKAGNLKQFLLLFDAVFSDVYKYVSRRVSDVTEIERIVRLTFLDALGQVQNVPTDSTLTIWLYSLAKPRVWDNIARASFPEKQGLIDISDVKNLGEKKDEFIEKANKVISKLSLEEREIMRLKFFEEVTDGDVMAIVKMSEGTVGAKIYRVLKRAHFLLFGESDARAGVYFGELTGFFQRLRDSEKIEIPEVFKLSLRADLSSRVDRKDFAINGEVIEEEKPFFVKDFDENATGSNDPAKIFVEAVREMRAEEAQQKIEEERKLERREHLYDFFEKWKSALSIIPVILFAVVVIFVLIKVLDFSVGVDRGYPTVCSIDVVLEGDFSDAERRSITQGVSDKICGNFDVKSLKISRLEDGKIEVFVDVPDWFLEYSFVKKVKDWRIKKYARTFSGDEKLGEV